MHDNPAEIVKELLDAQAAADAIPSDDYSWDHPAAKRKREAEEKFNDYILELIGRRIFNQNNRY